MMGLYRRVVNWCGRYPVRLSRPWTSDSTTLKRVAPYLHDVIVFDPDPEPVSYVTNIRTFFECLRKRNPKRSPAKAKLAATDADFLGHNISSSGFSPNVEKATPSHKTYMYTYTTKIVKAEEELIDYKASICLRRFRWAYIHRTQDKTVTASHIVN